MMTTITVSPEVFARIEQERIGDTPIWDCPRTTSGDVEIEVSDDVLDAIHRLDDDPDTALRQRFGMSPRGA